MQTIKLSEPLAALVRSGKKTLTIRAGVRPYEPRDAEFEVVPTGERIPIFIKSVTHTRLPHLDDDELEREGYGTWQEALIALQAYYPDLTQETMITVLAFRMRET